MAETLTMEEIAEIQAMFDESPDRNVMSLSGPDAKALLSLARAHIEAREGGVGELVTYFHECEERARNQYQSLHADNYKRAADVFTALQAELAALRAMCVEAQMNAYKWMEAHDNLKAGKDYKLPSPADLPDALAALQAELTALKNGECEFVHRVHPEDAMNHSAGRAIAWCQTHDCIADGETCLRQSRVALAAKEAEINHFGSALEKIAHGNYDAGNQAYIAREALKTVGKQFVAELSALKADNKRLRTSLSNMLEDGDETDRQEAITVLGKAT